MKRVRKKYCKNTVVVVMKTPYQLCVPKQYPKGHCSLKRYSYNLRMCTLIFVNKICSLDFPFKHSSYCCNDSLVSITSQSACPSNYSFRDLRVRSLDTQQATGDNKCPVPSDSMTLSVATYCTDTVETDWILGYLTKLSQLLRLQSIN